MKRIDTFFKLSERNTTVSTEILAGITTFMTMAYILAVNPSILASGGMERGAVFTATAIASIVATLCMGLLANLPLALMCGMGLNAFFAGSVASVYGWEIALLAVFTEGVLFILLSLFKVREALFDAIPYSIKTAITVGVGLFICFLGLRNGGIVVDSGSTLVTLGNIKSLPTLLCMIGVIITVILSIKKVRGAFLYGILITYGLGILMQIIGVYVPNPEVGIKSLYPIDAAGNIALISLPPSIKDQNLITAFMNGNFRGINWGEFFSIVFAFLFVDLFDTLGMLIGMADKANLLDENGKLKNAKQALLADAIGTTVGALVGTSTVTTSSASATGISAGGRTGLTAVTTAAMFCISLIFFPLFGSIPNFATAPALIVVGLCMISSVTKLDFNNFEEGLPAFLCIILMPLTYSIVNGLMFGMMSYVIIKVLVGKAKQVSPIMYIIFLLFLFKIIFS